MGALGDRRVRAAGVQPAIRSSSRLCCQHRTRPA